jgi:hypothetical protein
MPDALPPPPLLERLDCSNPKGYTTKAAQSKRTPHARYPHTGEVALCNLDHGRCQPHFSLPAFFPLPKSESKIFPGIDGNCARLLGHSTIGSQVCVVWSKIPMSLVPTRTPGQEPFWKLFRTVKPTCSGFTDAGLKCTSLQETRPPLTTLVAPGPD